MPTETPAQKLVRPALIAMAVALTSLMIIQSVMRRLNFDEWLILRAGWLITSQEPSNLHFLMPWTWLAGHMDQLLPSAPILVTVVRLMTAATILTTLAWALKAHHRSWHDALHAYLLTLSCGAFIAHGIEFRYDAVVLCAWMAAWGALAHPTPGRLRIVGALIVVLALHQTKGLLYAAALTLITWAINNRQEPKSWRQVLIGALMAAVPWFSLLLAQGLLDEQVAVYAQFARLRTELGAPAWTELLAQLRNDTYWWALAATATAMAIRRQILGSALHITSIMAIPPIAFILVHPHPWPYMLVPCIPLLSSLCITALATRPKTFTMFAACLTLAVFAMPHHIHALQADGRDDLQLLAQLRAVQTSDDRVLDPSGAAYFIKPATPYWYLDGLFRHRLAQGTWHPAPENPESLPQFVLRSYRLDWMDSFSPDLLGQHYENACHWLWIKKGDPRAKTLRKQCPSTGDDSLLNYWQIQP